MILVDSNIPMYLVGAEHPNKNVARRIIERAVAEGQQLVTDAEALQEILHRYVAIDRRDAIRPAFDVMLEVVDVVYRIELADVEAASRLVLSAPQLSARDAIHIAVMQRNDIAEVMTFDRGFDAVPGISRVTE